MASRPRKAAAEAAPATPASDSPPGAEDTQGRSAPAAATPDGERPGGDGAPLPAPGTHAFPAAAPATPASDSPPGAEDTQGRSAPAAATPDGERPGGDGAPLPAPGTHAFPAAAPIRRDGRRYGIGDPVTVTRAEHAALHRAGAILDAWPASEG